MLLSKLWNSQDNAGILTQAELDLAFNNFDSDNPFVKAAKNIKNIEKIVFSMLSRFTVLAPPQYFLESL